MKSKLMHRFVLFSCFILTQAISANEDDFSLKVAFNTMKNILLEGVLDGAEERLIYGGQQSEPGRYPYMAELRVGESTICGGSLVHPEWVLTAAHCAEQTLLDSVRMGDRSLNDYSKEIEIIEIDYQIIHPNYSAFYLFNDVMLLKLKTPSNYSVVNLSNEDVQLVSGMPVTVIGYGIPEPGCDISDVLNEVELDYMTNEECNELLDPQTTESTICAVRSPGGFCFGDSGGPLLIKGNSSEQDIQIGIVSWLQGNCAEPHRPGVYASVPYLYDFIKSVLEKDPGPCKFPDDGFNYTNCSVMSPCWLSDGKCDGAPYNTLECNYDGGDCNCTSFPEEDKYGIVFDYSNCIVDSPCRIGDGVCNEAPYNTEECNFDGKDCFEYNCDRFVDDGFDYSACTQVGDYPCRIGDGICDILEGFYVEECNYDRGDCDDFLKLCPYPEDGFDYVDCFSSAPCFMGNGQCDTEFNSPECNFDGGDCVEDEGGFLTSFFGF